MLLLRGGLAIGMLIIGGLLLARMFATHAPPGQMLPGLVLGAAMIGLGAHRLSLIARALSSR